MSRKVTSQASIPKIIKKKNNLTKDVTLSRVSTDLRYMGDVNFGNLDSSKDGLLVSYDSRTDEFILISADQILVESASDGDLPNSFISVLEPELNLGNTLESIDGGSF